MVNKYLPLTFISNWEKNTLGKCFESRNRTQNSSCKIQAIQN